MKLLAAQFLLAGFVLAVVAQEVDISTKDIRPEERHKTATVDIQGGVGAGNQPKCGGGKAPPPVHRGQPAGHAHPHIGVRKPAVGHAPVVQQGPGKKAPCHGAKKPDCGVPGKPPCKSKGQHPAQPPHGHPAPHPGKAPGHPPVTAPVHLPPHGHPQPPQHKHGEVTVETWVQFVKKYTDKITSFVTQKNWNALAQWLFTISKQADFPVKPCKREQHSGGGSRVIVIRLEGVNEQDLQRVLQLNQKSTTGSDGWWDLLVRIGLKGQPKPKQDEAVKIILEIVKKHQKEIRDHIQKGDWKFVIELLNKQSKEHKIDIDFNKVLCPKNACPNGKALQQILVHWSKLPQGQGAKLTLKDWLQPQKKTVETTVHKHPTHPGQHPHPTGAPHPGKHPVTPGPGKKVTKNGQIKASDKPHGPTPGHRPGVTTKPGHGVHPGPHVTPKPVHPGVKVTTRPGGHHGTPGKPNIPIIGVTKKHGNVAVTPKPHGQNPNHPVGHTPGPNVKVTHRGQISVSGKPNGPTHPRIPGGPHVTKRPGQKATPNLPGGHVTKNSHVTSKPHVTPRHPVVGHPVTQRHPTGGVTKGPGAHATPAHPVGKPTHSGTGGVHPRPHPRPQDQQKQTIETIVKQTGTSKQELEKAVQLNKQGNSGADGWFTLLTQQAGQKSPETSQKITTIVDQNQDQIKQKVKSGDWHGLIILLNEQSQKQGVQLDWNQILGDSKNSAFWKMILMKWASTPKQQAKHLDLSSWTTGDSDLAANRATSIILIIQENQEEVKKLVEQGDTQKLQLFLEQKAKEKGIHADWKDLDLSNPQSEGGQWFRIIQTSADKPPQELSLDQFYKLIAQQYGDGQAQGSLADFTNGFKSGFWQQIGSGSGSGGLSSLFGSLGLGGGENGGLLGRLGLGGGQGGSGGLLGGLGLGGGSSGSQQSGSGQNGGYKWSYSSSDGQHSEGSSDDSSSGGLLGGLGLGGGSGGSGGLLGGLGLGR